jgi:hypothetical protein
MGMEIGNYLLFDPLFTERFSLIRRLEVVGLNGRTVVTEIPTDNVVGVITMNDDNEVIRQEFPEIEYATRVISIVTKTKILTASKGYQPDYVVWRGDTYLARRVSPYPQFGSGFYQVVASSINLTDLPI